MKHELLVARLIEGVIIFVSVALIVFSVQMMF